MRKNSRFLGMREGLEEVDDLLIGKRGEMWNEGGGVILNGLGRIGGGEWE